MTRIQAYESMFREYPDVLNIGEMSRLLGVSKKTAYKILHENKVSCLKVGREYRVPKIHIINYLLGSEPSPNAV